jgi:hypothetical protein
MNLFDCINDADPKFVKDNQTALINALQDRAQIQKDNDKENRIASADKARLLRERKAIVIPEWCIANLKPGMIVKVKSSPSNRKSYRIIREIHVDRIVGLHYGLAVTYPKNEIEGAYFPYRRMEVWEEGNYVTSHLFTNIQGILASHDKGPAPVCRVNYIPIMDLVNGKQSLENSIK